MSKTQTIKFDTLYKKSSQGSLIEWTVYVQGSTIITRSGKVDGKLTMSSDTLKTGKNLGRSNETNKYEQAKLEAESKFTKKLKQGYTKTKVEAFGDKVDEIIEGGWVPMLAKSFDSHSKHIEYPCYVQPKLDGIRACTSQSGELYSRTRKRISSVPHIESVLKKLPVLRYDGELYSHAFKDEFEVITSAVRSQKTPSGVAQFIEYHIYDINIDMKLSDRIKVLSKIDENLHPLSCIKLVETRVAKDIRELTNIYEEFLDQGYEGAMVRNINSPYESKRSSHLQKMKSFYDSDFKIVGIKEGRGKLSGHVGAFVCRTKDGSTFEAKLEGKLDFLKECFENKDLWEGQYLTVKYQGFTKKNSVPRFPVGLKIKF